MSVKKILIVLTNRNTLLDDETPTGYWLSELTHVQAILAPAGYEFDYVSPQGGKAPVDPGSLKFSDSVNRQWYQPNLITQRPDQINPADYVAVYYPGGHGPLWDVALDMRIAKLTQQIYETGGVAAAVCHGSAGLLPVELADGQPLIAQAEVTGFSDLEERLVGKRQQVPFVLQRALTKRAKRYVKALLPFQSFVVTSGRIITGQNPQSAKAVGEALLGLLS